MLKLLPVTYLPIFCSYIARACFLFWNFCLFHFSRLSGTLLALIRDEGRGYSVAPCKRIYSDLRLNFNVWLFAVYFSTLINPCTISEYFCVFRSGNHKDPKIYPCIMSITYAFSYYGLFRRSSRSLFPPSHAEQGYKLLPPLVLTFPVCHERYVSLLVACHVVSFRFSHIVFLRFLLRCLYNWLLYSSLSLPISFCNIVCYHSCYNV